MIILGFFLRNIVFIGEGNMDKVNIVETIKLLTSTLSFFRKCQSKEYDIEKPNEMVSNFMNNMKSINDDDKLWEMSEKSIALTKLDEEKKKLEDDKILSQKLGEFF